MGAFTHAYCVTLNCPYGDNEYCYTPLPLQSPLGIYEDQQYRPIGEWPATFLCLRHGLASSYWPDSIHLLTEPRVQGLPVPQLWKIECECARENCRKLHTIYTARAPDPETVLKLIARRNPALVCGDHNLIWRDDLIRLTQFAFDTLHK